MITIFELQAMDYLLKSYVRENSSLFENLEIKLVIEFDGNFWSGDFIQYESPYIRQPHFSQFGKVQDDLIYYENVEFLNAVKGKYIDKINQSFLGLKTSNLMLLFSFLYDIVKETEIKVTESPIFPYLLNANNLDRTLSLPFINLKGKNIHVVSLIENKLS